MTPYWSDGQATLYHGDALAVLREMPSESVHCCVTSPPYFSLRDYGTARWEGSDADCDHVEMRVGMSDKNTLGPGRHLPETNAANVGRVRQYRDLCGKCGARRVDEQIGLEATPEAFIEALVDVFREVRRVLRSDGVFFCNIGDSYWTDSPVRRASSEAFSETWDLSQTASRGGNSRTAAKSGDLKNKDLIGIPWLLAFALRADGWWLRSEIVWAKRAPMPESVTDRPTSAHEKVFLLSKSSRYYYDAEAVREPAVKGAAGSTFTEGKTGINGLGRVSTAERIESSVRNMRNVWHLSETRYRLRRDLTPEQRAHVLNSLAGRVSHE